MSNLVPNMEIERLVGAKRQATAHVGRINTNDEVMYILHSQECKDSGIDLRTCPYSRALDLGFFNIPAWKGFYDMPVSLRLDKNERLNPVRRMVGLNVN